MRKNRSLFAGKIASMVCARPVPQQHVSKSLWRKIGGGMWRSLKRICMTLGVFVFLTSLLGAFSTATMFKQTVKPLPDKAVLFLKLEGTYNETHNTGGFPDVFASSKPTLHQIVNTLDHAARNDVIKGLYVRLGADARLELSHIQELRAAVKRFQNAGKFAHIYSPSYGEGGGLGAYYFASAFKNIWMQPIGVVVMSGMRVDMPFAREILDKIGVKPEFLQRKTYKSAYESLTHDQMTPANREALTRLVDDLKTLITADIAADRGIDKTTLMHLVDHGLFTAQAALDNDLVTRIGYADTLVGDMAELMAGDRDAVKDVFVPFKHYGAHMRALNPVKNEKRAKVALIHVDGTIMPSDVSTRASIANMATYASLPRIDHTATPLGMGGGIAAADEIATALLAAAEDKEIKVIVMRIDSPGGSPTASETILRAMQNAKVKGKTVIVSMGGAAASGGYWVASGADYIIAHGTTFTGSIGVIGGKFVLQDMWDKLDVHWDTGIGWGENAGMWSPNTPFSPTEKARVDVMLDQVYDGFIKRVATGRKKTPADVEKIAQGRVWSGLAAKEIGLIDKIGHMSDALDYAAVLNGLQNRSQLDVIVMPKPKTALEQFIELVESGGVIEFFKIHLWFAHQLKNIKLMVGV
jgi:protease-4